MCDAMVPLAPSYLDLEARLAAAEAALADERAAHTGTTDRLEAQRRMTRNTVERAVEMERQRNAERVARAAAEARCAELEDLLRSALCYFNNQGPMADAIRRALKGASDV